ncbi:hypothetical protein BJY01DRAFT_139088 [Aspergillus pseudoustus]|uniref:Uncharacterized protein n=1 Tax=Aspergillus pseudoustus TaxID=1810923 RepID=A0ABR4IHT8_9EURO
MLLSAMMYRVVYSSFLLQMHRNFTTQSSAVGYHIAMPAKRSTVLLGTCLALHPPLVIHSIVASASVYLFHLSF